MDDNIDLYQIANEISEIADRLSRPAGPNRDTKRDFPDHLSLMALQFIRRQLRELITKREQCTLPNCNEQAVVIGTFCYDCASKE